MIAVNTISSEFFGFDAVNFWIRLKHLYSIQPCEFQISNFSHKISPQFRYELDNGKVFQGRTYKLNFPYLHVYMMLGANDTIYWVELNTKDEVLGDEPFSKIVRLGAFHCAYEEKKKPDLFACEGKQLKNLFPNFVYFS